MTEWMVRKKSNVFATSTEQVDEVPNTVELRADDYQSLWLKQEDEQRGIIQEQVAQVRHRVTRHSQDHGC